MNSIWIPEAKPGGLCDEILGIKELLERLTEILFLILS